MGNSWIGAVKAANFDEARQAASALYNRATSEPINRIVKTLNTGKPAPSGGRSLSQDISNIGASVGSAYRNARARMSQKASSILQKALTKTPSRQGVR